MDRKGFSLIETLIVVVIVALLAGGGLYLKYFQQSQNAAQIGENALQQAKEVQQQVNTQTSQEQNAINQLNQNGTDTTAASHWKTYKDLTFGFSIDYPSDWDAVVNPDGVAIVGFGPHSGAGDNIDVKVYKNRLSLDVSSIQNLKASIDSYNRADPYFNSSIYRSSIENIGGFSVVMVNESSGYLEQGLSMYVLIGNGNVLEFSGTISDQDMFNTLKKISNSPINASDTEAMKEQRDSQRISDFETLRSLVELYSADVSQQKFSCVDTKTIYASAQITPPLGWKAGVNMGKTGVNGTGWIPIDFTAISSGSPLAKLPVDPVNDSSKHLVYLFVCDPTTLKYELDAVLESTKFNANGANDLTTTDGGDDHAVYEVGNGTSLPDDKTLSLIPNGFWAQ